MKTILCILLALPASALTGPAVPAANMPIAVFAFQTDGDADKQLGVRNAGETIARLLTDDLSVLAPLAVIDQGSLRQMLDHREFDLLDPITPGDAKKIGRTLGAATLVNGRIFVAGAGLIIAAKVVSADTGQTSGTMVKGDRSVPLADMISSLSSQIGKIALDQRGVDSTPWAPATIVGSRRHGSFLSHDEVACVMAIDGRPIPDETEKWDQRQPLLPGLHEVFVRYYDGTSTAGHDFVFNARPGASYEVNSERQEHLGPKLWILDRNTHQLVTVIADSTQGVTPDQWSAPGEFWWARRPPASPMNNPGFVRPPTQH
jgi:TolB-like protein